jgi:hypothetical protein
MTDEVTKGFIIELAHYGELPFDEERAEQLSKILGPALANLRAIRPDGYALLAPDVNFRVPVLGQKRSRP